jgi:ubiquinone/menaquinone biosynthesis C-methylase UbiE
MSVKRVLVEGRDAILGVQWLRDRKWVKNLRDYNYIHAHRAKTYLNPRGKVCLVVGCARGKDCTYFVEFGATEVHGVDIVDEIGMDFNHPKVKYHRTSAEVMDHLASDYYDLVYCFATMEHIPRIDLAFSEMVRVAKSSGFVYCFSAPLWNSRQGHHEGRFFESYPWIHLRLSKQQVIDYCERNNIVDREYGYPMESHVEYMFNPAYFHMLPAKAYMDVCNNLKGMRIIRNQLSFDYPEHLTPEIHSELAARGYTRDELLAAAHTFVGRKM